MGRPRIIPLEGKTEREVAVRAHLRGLTATGKATYSALSETLGVSRNAVIRWCSPTGDNHHMQGKILMLIERWIADGCRLRYPSNGPARVATPTREALIAAAAEHKTLSRIRDCCFPGICRDRLRRLLMAERLWPPACRPPPPLQAMKEANYRKLLRRIASSPHLHGRFLDRAVSRGHATQDAKLTHEGILFSIRAEDKKWLLNGNLWIAHTPQFVDDDHIHRTGLQWMLDNGICTRTSRSQCELTDYGRLLTEQLRSTL
jgi:hypothetical protein